MTTATLIPRFTDEPLSEIIQVLQGLSLTQDMLEFEVLNPDLYEAHLFNGEEVMVFERAHRHRHYQTWLDLAQSLGHVFLTPQVDPELSPYIRLRFRRIGERGWHTSSLPSGHPEKYGAQSLFARLHKSEEPYFLKHFQESLRWIGVDTTTRILSLGVNSGDELALSVAHLEPNLRAVTPAGHWVGVDHSASAIESARQRYPQPQFEWVVGDLSELDALALGIFDLVICLNTLQSSLIDEQRELKRWVKSYLSERGALILSFPQSRYVGTQQLYGDHSFHTLYPKPSKTFKLLTSFQRYLQQHGFAVNIRGKYTLFLIAKKLVK